MKPGDTVMLKNSLAIGIVGGTFLSQFYAHMNPEYKQKKPRNEIDNLMNMLMQKMIPEPQETPEIPPEEVCHMVVYNIPLRPTPREKFKNDFEYLMQPCQMFGVHTEDELELLQVDTRRVQKHVENFFTEPSADEE